MSRVTRVLRRVRELALSWVKRRKRMRNQGETTAAPRVCIIRLWNPGETRHGFHFKNLSAGSTCMVD
jgi:hypothetical protein